MSRYCKYGSIADMCGHDDCNPPSRPLPSSAVVLPYATPPGETLRETLKAKGISQTLLAETMGRPIKTINEIIHAKARITEQTAIQFEHALNIPAHFWMALETNYRIAVARQNDKHSNQGSDQ